MKITTSNNTGGPYILRTASCIPISKSIMNIFGLSAKPSVKHASRITFKINVHKSMYVYLEAMHISETYIYHFENHAVRRTDKKI